MANLSLMFLKKTYVVVLGQLYLGVFSGPVEGILMIIAIYVISGLYGIVSFVFFGPLSDYRRVIIGPSFWDTKILSFTRLDVFPVLTKLIPNIGLNEAFMVVGGFGLAFNIFSR